MPRHFDGDDLAGSTFRRVDLRGAELRGCDLRGARVIGAELVDVEITGELENVLVNGVDIAPLVEAELDRRDPERAMMRPVDADGFRAAWPILLRRWDETMARARRLPHDRLHEQVAGEWSFIQTLRHLNFASAAWVGRMIVGDLSPWHPLDLPWDEAPGWDGIPWDREARPSLDDVLAVRESRQQMVADVLAGLTDERLATTIARPEPGWPRTDEFPFAECLRIVLNEEWCHREFAERDLAVLAAAG